jgi:hypothetical protein
MTWLLLPVFLLVGLLVFLGLFILLAKFRNGKYLRPIVLWLSKIPWMRKQFEKASKAAIERQSPELASAIRKLERVGPNPDPQRAQQALSQLTATERRAYLELVEQQGTMPEPSNREQRRRQERMAQTNRPRGSSGGSSSSSSKRKKR